jgi:pimeloyl-ACP methyl ester carboxylesterase
VTPETRYAQSGDLSIAYQVLGDGPLDVLFIPGFVSNVELVWELPVWADLLSRFSRLGRFVYFDKRGTGCSDRTLGTGSSEDRMDDVRAVADAAGIEQAVIIGLSEGGPLAVLFAAAFPERVRSLVLWGTFSRIQKSLDYPIGVSPETIEPFIDAVRENGGTGHALEMFIGPAPDGDLSKLARYERQTATPNAAATILRHNVSMDVRHALPSIQVPTLVIHRIGDPIVPLANARFNAERIAGAKLVELPGDFHGGSSPQDNDEVFSVISEFITGVPPRRVVDVDRVLATVLFTDIVDSTARAAEMGDRAWTSLLERHDTAAAHVIDEHRGVLVKRTGDGLLATFDGPGRGIRAARSLQDAMRPLGIGVRAGLHTGEIERRVDDVAGIGVHIAARVSACAGQNEVFVTNTVKDLVIGSELTFEDQGTRELKGVPGDWHLWSAN